MTSNRTTRVKAQHRQVASPATQPETARSRRVGSTIESAGPTPCRVAFQARPALMKTDPAGWCISASAWRHSRKMEEKTCLYATDLMRRTYFLWDSSLFVY